MGSRVEMRFPTPQYVFGNLARQWNNLFAGGELEAPKGLYGWLGTNVCGVQGTHNTSGNYGRLGTENDGVTGYSNNNIGSGVYGHNTADGYGVYGRNINSDNYGYLGGGETAVYGYGGSGYGGLFTSDNDHFDLALGGAVGRINTDPDNENSDLILSSNNDVVIRLDNDGGEEGVFRIKNSWGDEVCTITESSNVSITQPYSRLRVAGHASSGKSVITGKATGIVPGEPISIGGGIGVAGLYYSEGVGGTGVYGEATSGFAGGYGYSIANPTAGMGSPPTASIKLL